MIRYGDRSEPTRDASSDTDIATDSATRFLPPDASLAERGRFAEGKLYQWAERWVAETLIDGEGER